MGEKNYYITTTAPYINADPHIGFALEIIQADVLARFHRSLGEEVSFGFGTDEHGLKIYRKAIESNIDPLKYCDIYAKKFDDLRTALNLSPTHFMRTTDPKHVKAAQEFWSRCYKNGDIYKKNYKIKYCVGCELEKTDTELTNNICPLHPNLKLEIYEEENYFFRFSKYQKPLLDLYKKNPDFVLPKSRQTEISNFVAGGLNDFSVSRLKKKMPWGIEVPNDPEHVMYVWFDALVFYISTLGWPINDSEFKKWWPGVQLAGTDNLRQQTAIWQSMLLSAGLPNSKQIFIHGFITSEHQKMSKSLGNVINPFDLVIKYSTDAVRYYLLKEIPSDSDGDYSSRRMEEIYNSDLANELGNLISRLTNLAEKDGLKLEKKIDEQWSSNEIQLFNQYNFNQILESIWGDIKKLNKNIDDFAPWKIQPDKRKDFLLKCLKAIKSIAWKLHPFLPETSEKIIKSVTDKKIVKIEPLFPKLK